MQRSDQRFRMKLVMCLPCQPPCGVALDRFEAAIEACDKRRLVTQTMLDEKCSVNCRQSVAGSPYSLEPGPDMTASIQSLIVARTSRASRLTSTPSWRGSRSVTRAASSTATDRHCDDRRDHRGRDPGAVLLQSSELALRCGHRSGASKKRARAISGGNHHFEFCSVLIYLCFQKGWTHDKFSIVQSVAGACYHMMLSAHLRGYRDDLECRHRRHRGGRRHAGHSADFRDPRGALHRPAEADAPADEGAAPSARRGLVGQHVFERPAHATYPAKPAPHIRSSRISNARNPFAEWRPQVGAGIASRISAAMRSGRSRRSRASIARGDRAKTTTAELEPAAAGRRRQPRRRSSCRGAARTRPSLRRRLAAGGRGCTSASSRRRQSTSSPPSGCGRRASRTPICTNDLMQGRTLPLPDDSVDAVSPFRCWSTRRSRSALLDEIARVLKPGGSAVISVRNR